MSRIISIDYGGKRTGLAVTDPLQIIATGLDTVATKELWEYLQSYISQEEVSEIIMGEPRHKDGNPTHLTPEIHKFAEKLNKKYPDIPITFVDESFSSVRAKEIILKSGAKKKKRRDKALVDKISAVLLLQEYLEKKRYSKK